MSSSKMVKSRTEHKSVLFWGFRSSVLDGESSTQGSGEV